MKKHKKKHKYHKYHNYEVYSRLDRLYDEKLMSMPSQKEIDEQINQEILEEDRAKEIDNEFFIALRDDLERADNEDIKSYKRRGI